MTPTHEPAAGAAAVPTAAEARFLAELQDLRAHATLRAMKLGTEEEDVDLFEIQYIRSVLPAEVDIVVKIGGPCARADMRLARQIGARGMVAPMVESVYALERFMQATASLYGDAVGLVERGINVETITAVERLDDMLACDAGRQLDFFNIGRSDLAGSLGDAVGSPRMNDIVCSVIEKGQAAGLRVHVGGQVTVSTLVPLISRVRLEGFHTRWLIFAMPLPAEVGAIVGRGLRVEIALLEMLAARFPVRAEAHLERARVTAARIEG